MTAETFAAFEAVVKKLVAYGGRPSLLPVRASFYHAWCRQWNAHALSLALGFRSETPLIR